MNQQNNQQPNLLVFGILALVLAELGIPGIIIGAIGRSKGKKFIQAGGTLTGASKVGYILSLVGLILGIVMTVVWIIIAIAGASGAFGAFNNIITFS